MTDSAIPAKPVAPAAILIIAGPSCVGKDALLSRLLNARPELKKVVTTTTRAPRAGEKDGVNYYFLTKAEFEEKWKNGELYERNQYGDNFYGLGRQGLEDVRKAGCLPTTILDVNGVDNLRAQIPICAVFVRAPIETIEERLRKYRKPEEAEARLAAARDELHRAETFDYIIDNGDGALEHASRRLIEIYDREIKQRLLSAAQPVAPASGRPLPVRNATSRPRSMARRR